MTWTEIRNRFFVWWKRSREQDFVYDDQHIVSLIRQAAESAYIAGWRAAKRNRRS